MGTSKYLLVATAHLVFIECDTSGTKSKSLHELKDLMSLLQISKMWRFHSFLALSGVYLFNKR